MDILVKRRKPGSPIQQTQKLAQPSPYDKRYGEWGNVELLHSEDNTVDIFLDSGTHLKRVPVSSKEWVVSGEDAEKDYNSGERNLPPEHARVFVMMPTGTYNDCFVLCSGFSTIDQTKPYMEDEKEKIKERITPSGWHITDDYTTGSHKSVSPDKKTSLEVDYGTEREPKEDSPELHINLFDNIKADVVAEDNVTVSVFDEVTIGHLKGESVAITAFDEMSVEHQKGDSTKISIFDELTLEHKKGDTCTIKALNTNITIKDGEIFVEIPGKVVIETPDNNIRGGTILTADGISSPEGKGGFCGLPYCLATGAPQASTKIEGLMEGVRLN